MVFPGFSKNYLDVLIVLYFQNLSIFSIISSLTCYFLFKFYYQENQQYHQQHLTLVHLYSTAMNFQIFSDNLNYIILNYTSTLLRQYP